MLMLSKVMFIIHLTNHEWLFTENDKTESGKVGATCKGRYWRQWSLGWWEQGSSQSKGESD